VYNFPNIHNIRLETYVAFHRRLYGILTKYQVMDIKIHGILILY